MAEEDGASTGYDESALTAVATEHEDGHRIAIERFADLLRDDYGFSDVDVLKILEAMNLQSSLT